MFTQPIFGFLSVLAALKSPLICAGVGLEAGAGGDP